MAENYTLLFLTQHFPDSQQLSIFTYDDVSVDADVADYLQNSEMQVSSDMLENVYSFAKDSLQSRK